MLSPISAALASRPVGTADPGPLRAQAQALETAFIAEMLKSAQMARVSSDSSGVAQDHPFDTFVAEAQARSLMSAGGLGLTESLLAGMLRASHGGAG